MNDENKKKIDELIKGRDELISNYKNQSMARQYQKRIDDLFKRTGEYLVHVEDESDERCLLITEFNNLVFIERMKILTSLSSENQKALESAITAIQELTNEAITELSKLSIKG